VIRSHDPKRPCSLFSIISTSTMSKPNDRTTTQAGLFTEAELFGPEPSPDDASSQTNTHDHAVVTAPLLTGDALDILGMDMFPQRAL
jgi:hypothetical protein